MSNGCSVCRERLLFAGAVIAVFLLGLALRLYQLDSDSMWMDEITTAIFSRMQFWRIPVALAWESVHPPLVYLLTHTFVALMGTSDWVIRLPSALLGSASIVLAYKLGESLWTRKEGLVGAFLLAVNAYHVHYSQEARHYAATVFLVLFSLLFLMLALRRGSSGSWFGFGLCSSLAAYTHYFALLVLPAQCTFALWVIWRRGVPSLAEDQRRPLRPVRQTLALTASLLGAGISYIPWLPAMLDQFLKPDIGFQGFGGITALTMDFWFEFFHRLLRGYTGWDGLPLLLLIALFLVGLWRCRGEQVLLLGLLIVTPFVFLVAVRARHFIDPRYTIFILPPCLLLVGRGMCTSATSMQRLLRRVTGRPQSSAVLLTPLVIFLGLQNVPPLSDYFTHFRREDFRGAAQYIADNLTPGDAIVAEGAQFRTWADDDVVLDYLPYYLDLYGVGDTPILRVRDGLWQELQNLHTWNGRLWGVVFHERGPMVSERVQVEVFPPLSVVRLREPSGRTLPDTQYLLNALLETLPPGEARFDIHLTLADICLRTGQLKEAEAQLQMASAAKPHDPQAAPLLEVFQLRQQELTRTLEGMRRPHWRSFGDVIALLGYDLHQGTGGNANTLELFTWWRALRDTDEDYAVFVHLLGPDGRLLAQQDRLIQRGSRPTSTWEVEETATQLHGLALPANAPPGEYTIEVGVFHWQTGERLAAWDELDARVADDAVPLQSISVGR